MTDKRFQIIKIILGIIFGGVGILIGLRILYWLETIATILLSQ